MKLNIIDNTPELIIKKAHPELEILEGNNTFGEFSGWQVAIDKIVSHESINDRDCFIFANDTANTHRYFTPIDKWLFRLAFKKAEKTNCIAGEVNKSKTAFTINNIEFNQWVSTYLFSLPGKYFIENKNLMIPYDFELPVVTKVKSTEIIFNNHIDPSISKHINAWLFPPNFKKGWYASESAPPELLRHKATMIAVEKAITWKACNLELGVISIYNSRLKKKYKRKMNRMRRVLRRIN